ARGGAAAGGGAPRGGRGGGGGPAPAPARGGRAGARGRAAGGPSPPAPPPAPPPRRYDYQPSYPTAFHALTRFTDERGKVTSYGYDPQGHRTSEQTEVGTTTWSWIQSGQYAGLLESTTDPRLNTTTYTYDTQRRLETEKDPYLYLTTYTYDDNGNPKTTKDKLGRVTTYVYTASALGLLTVEQ